MKDLIAKLKSDACLAMGGIWLHIDAREARIAELETKLQEQDAMLGRRPCQDDRCVKMAELEAQIAASADTDKLREAIAGISNNAITDAWESCGGVGGFYKSFGYQQFAHAVLDLAADAITSTALQAPVREVPETWISVEDHLPKVEELVIVYAPAGKHSEERIDFDFIDPNDDDHASWFHHNEHYEHFCVVAKPEGSIGPSEKAPYTHWMPLPASPVQQED